MPDAVNKWAGYSRLYEVEKQKEREEAATPEISSTLENSSTVEKTATVENIATLEVPTPEPLKPSRVEEISTVEIFAHPEQYYSTPNELDDRVMPTLKPSEQVVLRRLYRLTRGFHKSTCKVSRDKLAKACNISDRTVTDCIAMLERRGFIKRLNMDFGNANKQDRGFEIEMLLPSIVRAKSSRVENFSRVENSSTVENSAPNKRKALKENNKRESELSLDTKNCPDCQGSGFWYPEGLEKGVAKCKHVRFTGGK
jgi:DNA-binding Lrp family transcriptional regulator